MKRIVYVVATVVTLGLPASANEDEVTVNADAMQQIQDQQLIRFSGDVEVIMGEMIMKSDEGDAFYGDGGPSDLVEYRATGGRVTLTSPDQDVESDRAVYDFPGSTLTFTGSVILLADETRIESDEMIVFIDEGRTQFRSESPTSRITFTSAPPAPAP